MRLPSTGRGTQRELGLEEAAHRIRKQNAITATTASCDRLVGLGAMIVLNVLVEPLHAASWFAQVDTA
jgi:hypothetical protein